MLELNLSNSLDRTLRNQLIDNFKIIDKALYGSQNITREEFDKTLQGLRNIVYTINAGSDKSESNIEVQAARTDINGKQYVSMGARLDTIEQVIKRLGSILDDPEVGAVGARIDAIEQVIKRLESTLDDPEVGVDGKTPYFHTAWAYSADGKDRFTTVYPNLNLLDGSKDFSGNDWMNSYAWTNDGTYKGLTVKKRTGQWSGINKAFTAPKDGTYTFSAYIKSSGNTAYIIRFGGINSSSSQDTIQSPMGNNFDWTRDVVTLNLKAGDQVWIKYEISGDGKDSALWTAGHKWEGGSVATTYMPSASEVTTADYPNYIGQYINFVQEDSTNPSDYIWSLIHGQKTYTEATDKTAGLMSAADKTKLDKLNTEPFTGIQLKDESTGDICRLTVSDGVINVTDDAELAKQALDDLKYATQNNDFTSFDKKWAYSGTDLGFNYSPNRTTFKIWAPTATSVKLISYGKTTNPTAPQVSATSMTRGTSAKPDNHAKNTIGVWSVNVPGDQNGMVYAYQLTFANGTIIDYANSDYGKVYTSNVVNITNDPYSIATTQGGKRSVVVSPESVKSNLVLAQGESATWRVLSPTHAIVNEMHIRDFTISQTSGVSEANRGKYLGVIESGTKNPNTGTPTGLDYLKNEGFNYVQLMPVSQYSSVDESGNRTPDKPNNYNWGYDPQNEMVPVGIYASDSINPATRIIEMKQMIQGLHDNGIGVIMDMVFNHVHDQGESPFEKSVPGYYFRRYSESGCGNDTASDREMFGKFIIDAVLYWAKNYDIDGFRFDLMSIIDTATMNKLRAALTEIDPHIITYGEGWGYPNANNISETSIKDPKKVPDIGFFNPSERDAIVNNEGRATGFASGNTSNTTIVASALLGSGGWNGSTPLHDFWKPGQSVNYIESHDGWTLNELLWSANPHDSVDTHRKRVAFANAVNILANGITFMETGQEFCRSKLVNPSNLTPLSPEETQAYQSGSMQQPAWYSAAWETAKNSYNGLFCLDSNGNYHGNYWPGNNLGTLIVAGDVVNGINWDNVKYNQKNVDFIGKLIKFKRSNPLFWWNDYRYSAWDTDNVGVEKVTNASNGVITEELGWKSTRYLVVYNASGNSVKIGQGGQFYGSSDLTGKTVIISNDDSLTDNQVLNSSVTLSNLTVTIIKLS